MFKFTGEQVQNTVFTAIVAVAAVALYLLSGKCAPGPRTEPTPSPTPSPAAETPAPREGFASLPESVFLSAMVGDTAYQARETKDKERSYDLVYQNKTTGSATLTYTLRDGMVESVTLAFPLRDKPPSKPKTKIEKALAASYPAHVAAQNEAMKTILSSALSACDLNGVLIEPVLLRWYSGLLAVRDDDKSYSDTFADCAFSAYPSQLGKQNVAVCSLLLP